MKTVDCERISCKFEKCASISNTEKISLTSSSISCRRTNSAFKMMVRVKHKWVSLAFRVIIYGLPKKERINPRVNQPV